MIKKTITLLFLFLIFSFFIVSAQSKSTSLPFLKTGWYFVTEDGKGIKMRLDNDSTYFFINPKPILTAKNIDSLSISLDINGMYGIVMRFDKKATQEWYLATRRSINERLAFIFDNNLLCTPKVYSEISNGFAGLSGNNFSKERLENIMAAMKKENR